MRRLFYFLFPLPLFCVDFTAFAQVIDFTIIGHPKEEGVYQVRGLSQDPQGYLWMATTNGLFKYDGYQYTTYHNQSLNTNSPAAVQIECVTAAKEGAIWFAPFGTGLDRLDPTTSTFTHFRHYANDTASLANDTVSVILQDRDGTIWIGTNSGLDKFDPRTNQFIHYRNRPNDTSSLSCNDVRAIYEDKKGIIWIGTGSPFSLLTPNDGGLNKFNKTTGIFTRYLHEEHDPRSLADNRVRAIFEDSRGNFWIGTAGDGLHIMNREKGTFERYSYDALNPRVLSRPPLHNVFDYGVDHITFISEDHKGRILIGTFEAGINVYDPATQKMAHYGTGKNSNTKLVDDHFWAAYKTRDNITWVSTWEGNVYRINPYQSKVPYVPVNKAVICFTEDDANGLWITTQHGLIHKDSTGKEEQFLLDKDPVSTSNQCFFILKEGNKFWVTSKIGLQLFDPLTKTFSNYRHRPGDATSLITDTLATLTRNADNTMWVGSSRGLDLMDIQKGTFRHFLNNLKDADSLPVNAVFYVTQDRFKNLWVGTTGGLFRLDIKTGNIKRYLNKSFVSHIFEDKAGTVWAASDAGLFTYNKDADKFSIFSDESAIITGVPVFYMAEDKEQNLWIASIPKGIIRLNKERNSAVIYAKNQGVNGQNLTGYILADKNGEILVADTGGYYKFPANLLQENVSAPIVIIRNFLLNNISMQPSPSGILPEPLLQTKEILLTHDQNTFSFQFANIDFSSDHEDTRLQYKMQNYDSVWRTAGEEKTAYYFNLPTGKYIFKLKAINSAGIAAAMAINIVISPPWWKTWWARMLGAVILISLGYILYRNRTNQIKRKQASQINIMVAAQEGERKRISRDLHDDVGTKLSAIKLFISSLNEKAVTINNEEIKSLAESSEQFITEVMQDVRQLLLNLSPAVLEDFGYATAVEGLVNKINQTKQIHFNLVMFGMKERLQKNYELALYRITQELMNNVLKHADAKNVSLQIGQRDEKIVLMIEDDGKGFDVNTHKDGYGLHNLTARTQLMNGTMVIDSHPGKGTSVLIEIPYKFN